MFELDLPEFKYLFGDPRLCLLEFVDTISKKVCTYVDPSNLDVKKDMIIFKRRDANTKGDFMFPRKHVMQELAKAFQDARPIVIIPIIVLSKNNRQKHVNYLLYNKFTHEIERIDIKKYHLVGFHVKKIYQKLKDSDLRDFLDEQDAKLQLLPEHDVPISFMSKHPGKKTREVFPVYILAYIALRCKYVRFLSSTIHKKLLDLPDREFNKYYNIYKSISNNMQPKACRDGQVLRYATNNCLYTSSKRALRLLVDPPIKSCPMHKSYNIITKRCVDPSKLKSINMMLDDIAQVKVDYSTKFEHIASNVTLLPAVNFVLSKYPSAFLVVPKGKTTKGDICITWFWKKHENQHKFTVPDGLLTAWNIGQSNPTVRFLVVLLSLTSSLGGSHANCLIYDKRHNEIERFDAIGETHESYDHKSLDDHLKEWFASLVPSMKYYKPIDFCPPKYAFQRKESREVGYDDSHGNCAVWRLWYIDLRLGNPHLTRTEIIKLALHRLKEYGAFQKYIKSYQAYILKHILPQPIKK